MSDGAGDDDLDDRVAALYARPLDAFVAARDALAKELRGEGRREDAAAVKARRRPTVGAWAVDQLASAAPDDLAALMSVSAALADAQLSGDHDLLRERTAEHRRLLGRLVDVAASAVAASGRDGDAIREAVRSTLLAAGSDDEVRRAVLAGMLAAPAAASGLGPLPEGWAPSPRAAPKAAAPAPAPPRKAAREAEEAAARARRAARKGAEAALRDATERRRAAERELAAARQAEEEASAALADLDAADG